MIKNMAHRVKAFTVWNFQQEEDQKRKTGFPLISFSIKIKGNIGRFKSGGFLANSNDAILF